MRTAVFLALAALLVAAQPSQLSASELHKAARKGDANSLKALIEGGADINELDNAVGAPLHWAAARGHFDVTRLLVEAGASIDEASHPPDLLTPLQMAASGGHLEIVRYLAESGANLSAGAMGIGTPLHFAAGNDHAEVVEFLLSAGADPYALSSNAKATLPLHYAAQSGGIGALTVLLDHGLPVDMSDTRRITALQIAVSTNSLEAAELLIESGADPHNKSELIATPVYVAQLHEGMKALFESFGIHPQ